LGQVLRSRIFHPGARFPAVDIGLARDISGDRIIRFRIAPFGPAADRCRTELRSPRIVSEMKASRQGSHWGKQGNPGCLAAVAVAEETRRPSNI